MILAVDTSLGTAVAVVDLDGTVWANAASENHLGHAEVIGTLIDEALREAGDPIITHVAAGMGPGPFTGLRIGIAAARTFALAREAVLVPVVSHDAIALEKLDADPSARFVVHTDARRRELAWSTYAGLDENGLPVRTEGPALVLAADAAAAHEGWDVEFVDTLSGAWMGILAARAIAAGQTIGPDDALYLRSPDVAAPKARP